MNRFDSLPPYDREWARILEESADEESAEQDSLRLDRGLHPLRDLASLSTGLADRRSSPSLRRVGPESAHPAESSEEN